LILAAFDPLERPAGRLAPRSLGPVVVGAPPGAGVPFVGSTSLGVAVAESTSIGSPERV